MAEVQKGAIEALLLKLVRAGLSTEAQYVSVVGCVSASDWRECYKLACAHGVMAIAWDGISVLGLSPTLPRDLRLNWGLAVQRYEEKYHSYCSVATELSSFYRNHGIAMVQMKGVGFSSYYPKPEHREGGDIDIYTFSADESLMSNAEANSLADSLISESGIEVEYHCVKHSNFYYKGIPVENHKTFLNTESIALARPMNDLLLELLSPRQVCLNGGQNCISVPSHKFNALFLAFHAAQHFGSGLCLHHIVDWAILLKTQDVCMPEEVKDKKFLRFVNAITSIAKEIVDIDVATFEDSEYVLRVREQLFNPLYPHKQTPQVKTRFEIIVFKLKRLIYSQKLSNMVFDRSFLKRILDSAIAHLKSPETIFKLS